MWEELSLESFLTAQASSPRRSTPPPPSFGRSRRSFKVKEGGGGQQHCGGGGARRRRREARFVPPGELSQCHNSDDALPRTHLAWDSDDDESFSSFERNPHINATSVFARRRVPSSPRREWPPFREPRVAAPSRRPIGQAAMAFCATRLGSLAKGRPRFASSAARRRAVDGFRLRPPRRRPPGAGACGGGGGRPAPRARRSLARCFGSGRRAHRKASPMEAMSRLAPLLFDGVVVPRHERGGPLLTAASTSSGCSFRTTCERPPPRRAAAAAAAAKLAGGRRGLVCRIPAAARRRPARVRDLVALARRCPSLSRPAARRAPPARTIFDGYSALGDEDGDSLSASSRRWRRVHAIRRRRREDRGALGSVFCKHVGLRRARDALGV